MGKWEIRGNPAVVKGILGNKLCSEKGKIVVEWGNLYGKFCRKSKKCGRNVGIL